MVSILIPTFNRSKYLVQSIESALAQTVPCEVVVCDHGSTDDTPQVVAQFGNKIKYIRREVDFGVHFCWLEGLLNCSNEFVHFNFDDDLIHPNFIEKTLEQMTDEVGMVFTRFGQFTDADVDIQKDSHEKGFIFKLETGTFNWKKIEFDIMQFPLTPISPGCTLIRKKILLDNSFVGSVPLSKKEYRGVGPDLLYVLMAGVEYKKFGFVNEKLAYFRAHEGSITTDSYSDAVKMKKIQDAYTEARKYFLVAKLNKGGQLTKSLLFFYKSRNIVKLVRRKLNAMRG